MDKTARDAATALPAHTLCIANRFRWALLAALLVFNNLGIASSHPVGWANVLLVLGVALAVYAEYRVGQDRALEQRDVLVISAAQDLLITAAIWLTNGYHSHLFVLYYPSLVVLGLVLPLPTSVTYASAVGVVYAGVCLFGTGGTAAMPSMFMVLAERWLALFTVLGLSAWAMRYERGLASQAETRVARLQQTSDALRAALDTLAEVWHATTSAIDPASLARQIETVAAELRDDCRQIEDVAGELTGRAVTATHREGLATRASRQAAGMAHELMSHAQPTTVAIEQAHAARNRARGLVAGWSMRSETVGELSAVVRKVADQTNLLAFNANIEAIQAGERGRRFAVVADEVRVVGEQAIEMAREIDSLSIDMWEGTHQVLDAIDDLEELLIQASALADLALQLGKRQHIDAEALVFAAEAAAAAARDSAPRGKALSGIAADQAATVARLQDAANRLDGWAAALRENERAVDVLFAHRPAHR